MDIEFAEREYESAMNFELMAEPKWFTPSQPLEKTAGFDIALVAMNAFPFAFLGEAIKTGIQLSPPILEVTKQRFDSSHFPRFKFNLFLNYKVGEYIRRSNGKEYTSWHHSYYRFDPDDDQQQVLTSLQARVGHSALVAYAAPSFHTRTQLYKQFSRKWIANSHYVKPATIGNHGRYSYVPGKVNGKVHSESEDVEGFELRREIAEKIFESSEEMSNSQFIINTSRHVVEASQESNNIGRVLRNAIAEFPLSLRQDEFLSALATTQTFASLVNLSWMIVGSNQNELD